MLSAWKAITAHVLSIIKANIKNIVYQKSKKEHKYQNRVGFNDLNKLGWTTNQNQVETEKYRDMNTGKKPNELYSKKKWMMRTNIANELIVNCEFAVARLCRHKIFQTLCDSSMNDDARSSVVWRLVIISGISFFTSSNIFYCIKWISMHIRST